MNTETISILEEDLAYAQTICASISDVSERNKCVANVIGAKMASRYFDKNKYKVDTESGLHNITKVLSGIDISDIYVNDNYIDVRVYFSDNEIAIPKQHIDLGIMPVAYMFIKLSADLQYGTVTGFVLSNDIDYSNLKTEEENITLNKESLKNIELVDLYLQEKNATEENNKSELIYGLLDGSLSEKEKLDLLSNLIKSKNLRFKLHKAIKAETIFNLSSIVISDKSDVKEQVINAQEELSEDDLEDLFDDTQNSAIEYTTEVTPGINSIEGINEQDLNYEPDSQDDSSQEDIEQLFDSEQKAVSIGTKKKKTGLVIFLLTVGLICLGGYWWYTNYYNRSDNAFSNVPTIESDNRVENTENTSEPVENTNEAMPVETVESVTPVNNSEEGNAASIPAIEKSLDASVLVSNLKIDWEVPSAYTTNNSAKRYFVKLGKIIQLNLKTELLLLSKPPLANKITVELRFNSDAERFEVVGIKDSSGEKTVDDAIISAVKSALDYSIGSGMSAFSKLQGNPIIIIHL